MTLDHGPSSPARGCGREGAILALVGIIANPASGKDIRRLAGHTTPVDNQAKISIVRRILLGLGAAGIHDVLIMPDTHSLGERAREGLNPGVERLPDVRILDLAVTGQAADSAEAARRFCEAGVRCIIVLGGDGTVRAVSKGAGEVPLLPISTGTNNVLPCFVEGTIAGLAAAAVARGQVALDQVAVRHKWLEVAVNGAPVDRALVDAAILSGQFVGSRAIWGIEDLRQVVVTRADPSSIGISAIAAVVRPTPVEEPVGVALTLGREGRRMLAAIGPGLLTELYVASVHTIALGETVEVVGERPLILALDGEREVVLYEGDTATLTLCADGPWIVSPHRVMQEMVVAQLFDR